jgi:hypothetical protein
LQGITHLNEAKTNVAYSYQAYGLGIRSDICLPELHVGKAKVDIEIKLGKIDAFLPLRENNRNCTHTNEFKVLLSYANIASFLIIQDKQIIVDPVLGVDERLLRLRLLSQALGVILHQRGLLVLHGSAVMLHNSAVVFLGPSGMGKSTTAASLKRKGYSLLADEVVAIDIIGDMPFVFPAFPQLKLLPDVAEHLGFDPNPMGYDSSTDNKLITRFDSDCIIDPIHLKKIYLLEMGENIEIRHLRQQNSMIELVRNSYSVVSLKAGVNISSHFSKCTKIAKDISICRAIRSSSLKNLADFAQALDDDIRKDPHFTRVLPRE